MSYIPQNTRMNQSEIDFGHLTDGLGDTAVVTVAATWVTDNSVIIVQAPGVANADHDSEDALLEEIQAVVTNIVAGVSFDILGYAPNGTWGRYIVSYIALIRRVTS